MYSDWKPKVDLCEVASELMEYKSLPTYDLLTPLVCNEEVPLPWLTGPGPWQPSMKAQGIVRPGTMVRKQEGLKVC